VAGFVVCRDGNVDELEGRVGVAEGDDGDGDLGAFLQGLVVCSGIRCNDKTGLHKIKVRTGRAIISSGWVGIPL
jgi:hypothetical protein